MPLGLGEREEVAPVADAGHLVGSGEALELLGMAHQVGDVGVA